MYQRKLRVIKPKTIHDKYDVYGVNIPRPLAIFFQGVTFTLEKSGTSIILTSGTKISYSKEEIENYNFEDCRI